MKVHTLARPRAGRLSLRGAATAHDGGARVTAMILIVDNYDSFTFNLVQRIGELDPDARIEVRRNDRVTADEAQAMAPQRVIISPGPCTPNEAGVSAQIIERFAGRVPVLGVCLGHQCIGALHGLTVERHSVIMHGKTSPVHHDHAGVFRDLPSPFTATRYHSLVVRADERTLAELATPRGGRWELSAWSHEETTGERVIMGLRRVGGEGEAPLEGVQFHPESFLTAYGPRLLANFLGLEWPAGVWRDRPLDPDPLEVAAGGPEPAHAAAAYTHAREGVRRGPTPDRPTTTGPR
jgi:anthranilate synthase/aminodeoxychorismate synthase-like glutamine amidotransferase